MKISQKRNCNGCRCSCGYPDHYYCHLGYKVSDVRYNREIRDFLGLNIKEGKPEEPCPKPMTYADTIAAENDFEMNKRLQR